MLKAEYIGYIWI